jgi:transcriptional regulator with XRE-family HTH domain
METERPNAKKNGRQPSVVRKVRVELARRGWTLDDLALVMGVSAPSVLNLLSGNNASERARHRCEHALGMVPIWHSPEVVAARRASVAFYDADPRQMSRSELGRLARQHLRPAGYPAQIRPMSRLLQRLEEFALQGGRPAHADVSVDDRSPAAIHRRITADLRARGWSRLALAGRMGFKSERVVSALMTGLDRAPRRRRLLENCMDAAYWSAPEEFAARQPIIRFYGGVDPHTLTVSRLKKLRVKHLPFGQRDSGDTRTELIAQMEEHAAIHREPARRAAKGSRKRRQRGARRSRGGATSVKRREGAADQ